MKALGLVVSDKKIFESFILNKRAQRALGRSPEERVKGHSGANNREPQEALFEQLW